VKERGQAPVLARLHHRGYNMAAERTDGRSKEGGPVARPTKLTAKVQKKICDAIRAGNHYEAAARYAGIGESTLHDWRAKGKKGDPEFLEFLESLDAAEAEAEVRIVALWQQRVPDDWRAARDFLARRFPQRWGPQKQLDVTLGTLVLTERIVDADGPANNPPARGGQSGGRESC